ncbi:multicomponent Na+:H+ antiporter subunit G [Mumia flava]|uniref:Multicomponent Na+:H+ antiporter subunit G n=1 Tax=Mumia flava TaxID=1348852 RepID=A0A0B2BNS0_9ACTN|nr:monovalent cation/H(+) antiporter subunit G [Mumia flava]PJJ57218.1 multicomponent Na+:H+ antiporter subunit G [Mumia flava]
MSLGEVTDAIAVVCLLLGAALSLVAAIGVLRFSNLFSRMHAATKPQTLGLLLVLAGIALRLDDWRDVGLVLLVALFQLLTVPVSSHMLGRATYRAGDPEEENLLVDERMPRPGGSSRRDG